MFHAALRTGAMYLLLILSLRLMGKRQIGELEPNELVVAVLLSELAAAPVLDDSISFLHGTVCVLTLLISQVLVSVATVKSGKFRRLLCGKPSILIDNGKIDQQEMRRNRISLDELFVELRAQGVSDISTVRHAILETNGTLSVILYGADSPVTPKQMGLNVPEPGLPVSVINDGRTLSDNLRELGRDAAWLNKTLKEQKVKSPEDVFLMTVDGNGAVTIIRKE